MKRRLGARNPLAIDAEKIAEQQARLDAIVEFARQGGPLSRNELVVLAIGKPRRECTKLVKRYGKEKR